MNLHELTAHKLLDLFQAGQAGDRGHHPGVGQLQLGIAHRGLVCLHGGFELPHQGVLGVELLLRCGLPAGCSPHRPM